MVRGFTDIRQSPGWEAYLKSLGWHCHRTSRNIAVFIYPFFIGNLVKIQRAPVLDVADLKEVEALCRQEKAAFIKIEVHRDQNLTIFREQEYVQSLFPLCPTSTFYIDLEKSQDDLWNAISHSGKYSIKRAQREGTTVEFVARPSLQKLKDYYPTLAQTGKKQKFYVMPFDDLVKRVDIFGDKSYLTFVYNADKVLCSAKFYQGYDDMILYVHGGTTDVGRKNKAGYELLWQSILHFKALGYKILDLEGKDDKRYPSFTKNWGGFSHFKEKFGGEVVEFPVPQIKYLNRGLKLLTKYTNVPI